MKHLSLYVAVAVLAGCATTGAHYVPVVDTKGHDAEAYAVDLSDCQAFATQRANAAQGAVAGAIVGALLGALIAPHGYGNQFATSGALMGGVSAGADANETQETIIKRCLSGRGYSVLN